MKNIHPPKAAPKNHGQAIRANKPFQNPNLRYAKVNNHPENQISEL